LIYTKKKLFVLALYAAEIMLKNGGETYRVEDTIVRICKTCNIPYVEAFVTPTGIIISVDEGGKNDKIFSFIKRIKNRTIDLDKVSQVNDFSRRFTTSDLSIEEGMDILRKIDRTPKYNKHLRLLGAGISSAFFGLLLQCTIRDFICSFLIGICVYLSVVFVENLNSNLFIQNLIGGGVAALLALLSMKIDLGINLDKIIISSIMILLPGVGITNAVRDSISGDLLSGLARAVEAFTIAISIAVGVGIIIKIWLYTFGGIL
jgi:uncharacterized membrane protein YjjP (DUF1212 family)